MFRLNRKPKKGLIGVDISSTSVKVLALSVSNGRYEVIAYAVEPLPEGAAVEKNIVNPEVVSEAIERAIAECNPITDEVAFAIPTASVISKVIEMDQDMNDDEREVQIRLDAEQYIPFPLDEVSLDFEVVSIVPHKQNKVNVLLVATRTENVEVRNEALIYAGLTPKVADVESLAIERAFSVFSNTLPIAAKIIALFDIGHSIMTLSILDEGKIVYTREQSFGGKQLTQDIQKRYGLSYAEAERVKKDNSLPEDYEHEVLHPFMDALAQQAKRSLQLFYSASEYDGIDHILLAGGTANLESLPKLLQNSLGYRVTIADPFLQMTFAQNVNIKKIKQDAPALMVACGAALRSFD
ncbi:type IV pilus assembly protein PilM [Acinetobacter nectaris]|uniref:type IV pilus assembly protein PilM n=1 Tax=Acinetobacter nectaris TaxID=1219382 RepID=UPI001F16F70D|nr:pilus assembly protein PilM [Acinetobacter nectaris]